MNREAPGQDAESSLMEHLLELRTRLVRGLAGTGLILADSYDAEILRLGSETPLPPARRKMMTARFARHAALRHHAARDPSGVSLYPGQATTGLCPVETFDGEPLYRQGEEPGAEEIEARIGLYYRPYHMALSEEISRLRNASGRVVVYDCHSIRSAIPRLFAGKLPVFNLGTNSGASADPELVERVSGVIAGSGRSHVIDGRFKGGYITRHYGQPEKGIHALQMELACRGYIRESQGPVDEANWPIAFDPAFAAPTLETLRAVLAACVAFAKG